MCFPLFTHFYIYGLLDLFYLIIQHFLIVKLSHNGQWKHHPLFLTNFQSYSLLQQFLVVPSLKMPNPYGALLCLLGIKGRHTKKWHTMRNIFSYQIINTYMKNWEPFVSFPLLAIDKRNSLLCLTAKLSSTEKQSFQLYYLKITSKIIPTPLHVLRPWHVLLSTSKI